MVRHSAVRSVPLRVQAASQRQLQQADQPKATHQQVDVTVADLQGTAQHHAVEDNIQPQIDKETNSP